MALLAVKRALIVATVLVVVIAVVVTVTLVTLSKDSDEDASSDSGGGVEFYKNGSVAADHQTCSKIGVAVLKEQGSVVDAAVAALFCLGVLHPHSSGIGGGGYMLIYHRADKEVKYYDFRETAPAVSYRTMFVNRTQESKQGYLSIAVPGEVQTMYKAWQTYGKLPWKRLVQPAIDLTTNGFEIDERLAFVLGYSNDTLLKDDDFRALYYHDDNTPRKQGDIIKDPIFAKTLTEIADDPLSFHNGSLMRMMVKDIQENGGIVTEDDFRNFIVAERRVLTGSMSDNDTLYTTSATTSGATMIMILNILKGFNFGPDALSDANLVGTWHKILEAFKFGFAYRPFLGDPQFNATVENSEDLQVNASYAELLREKIWANSTHTPEYYGGFYRNEDDRGTTHLCILGPSGDAVSVTSTLGWYFGAKVRSKETGIVYNNHMSTFSLPNIAKSYQPKSSEANNIAPGKRSMSTACPTIVVDNQSGDVKMVVGASGGLRITSGVPTVLMNKLWFGLSVGESVSRPRLHHQLHPDEFTYETKKQFRVDQSVIDGLKALGHKGKGKSSFCAVQAIYRDNAGKIYAMSDPRKTGIAAGY